MSFLLLFITLLFRLELLEKIKSWFEIIYMENSHELYLQDNIYYIYILPTWKFLCFTQITACRPGNLKQSDSLISVWNSFFGRAFLFFYWSIVPLQCCISFCCTTTWISYVYTCMHISPTSWPTPQLPPPIPPLYLHHRTLSWAPCVMQQLPTTYLFYTWQCIHVNATLSVHPTVTLPLCPHVCSLYICANRFISTTSLSTPYICVNICHLFFSFWLTSLCLTISRSIHTSLHGPISFFLWVSNILLYICTTSSLSVRLSMDI